MNAPLSSSHRAFRVDKDSADSIQTRHDYRYLPEPADDARANVTLNFGGRQN